MQVLAWQQNGNVVQIQIRPMRGKIRNIVNTTVCVCLSLFLKLFPLHSVNTASTKKHEMADRRKQFQNKTPI